MKGKEQGCLSAFLQVKVTFPWPSSASTNLGDKEPPVEQMCKGLRTTHTPLMTWL